MAVASKADARFGQLLVEEGLLSQEEIEQALGERKKRGIVSRPLGNFLVETGYVKEADALRVLGRQFNLAVIDLQEVEVQPDLLERVSEEVCRKYCLLPLFAVGEEVTVAVTDPTRLDATDLVARRLKCTVQPVLASEGQVLRSIDARFGKPAAAPERQDLASLHRLQVTAAGRGFALENLRRAGEEAPIVKAVDKILTLATEEGASDIHVEPGEESLLVRFRIDGILQKRFTFAIPLATAIVSRIKILAELDISERHKPQDGRFEMKIAERELEFRVSVLPVLYGEKVVIRILDQQSVRVDLAELGLGEKNLTLFNSLIRQPNGIVLVTGPTGSGKSTTLYAALHAINSLERNIVTVEDPVEFQMPLINQVGVNPKRGITFAGALRSILRQDPDVILVGEIRDPETGSVAAEAALTGHLVLSTLHTNDAPSAITRLMEMGIQPFLIAPTLNGVLAQRLVRRICPRCKVRREPTPAEVVEASIADLVGKVPFYAGRGCDSCGGSGYRGRTGIHELLRIDEEIRQLISERASTSEIRRVAAAKGFRELRFEGLRKAVAGVTTLEEVVRVTTAHA